MYFGNQVRERKGEERRGERKRERERERERVHDEALLLLMIVNTTCFRAIFCPLNKIKHWQNRHDGRSRDTATG